MFKKFSLLLALLSLSSLSADQFGPIEYIRPSFAADWTVQKKGFCEGMRRRQEFSFYSFNGNQEIYPALLTILDKEPTSGVDPFNVREALYNFSDDDFSYSVIKEEKDSILFEFLDKEDEGETVYCVGKLFLINNKELYLIVYALPSKDDKYNDVIATLKLAKRK